MTISTARVQINNNWYNLNYDSSSGKWKTSTTAPNQTSYNMSGGYYPVTVEATNTAGTTGSATINDPTVGNALKLVVRERVAPVITIVSPTNGAYVTNNQPNIVINITDEAGGSGINLSTLSVLINGTPADNISNSPITNGYMVTVTPPVLDDGENIVIVNVSDNDGNAAEQKTVTFTIDTIPPTLNIINPTDNLITNSASIIVSGTTNDITSSPVTVRIKVNSGEWLDVTVQDNGSFERSVTLAEGSNTIIITATDKAERVTTVNRTVILDTSIPKITEVTITPNPVDAGATMEISVVIEG